MTVVPGPEADRDVAADVRVARVHLRMGQLTLARAELEDLLRRDALDAGGLAVLAEARWRTGEGGLAAEAAIAHLDAGGSDDVAICIAAEALAGEGRTEESRELMLQLPASDAVTLDLLFAGMPRRASWPAGPVDRSNLEALRRDTDTQVFGRSMLSREAPTRPSADAAGRPAPLQPRTIDAPGRAIPGPREVIEATASGALGPSSSPAAGALSAAATGGRSTRPVRRRAKAQMDPLVELARAREELDTRPDRALLRLGLVLRHDPTLAPAVLEALHLRREPAAALLRGDAQRLLGRHLEAEAAFDAAAEALEVS
jgi:hypothetical protein